MNIPEILPCPFCRKIPSGNNYHGNLSSACGHLICEHCGAEGPSAENNMESAILAWNRRQPTPEAALNTKMLAILQRLEDWGVREDQMFTETREKTLFKLISDAQTVLHEAKP